MFKSARFINKEHDTICATRQDGSECFVPVTIQNADYRLITQGDRRQDIDPLKIEPFQGNE